MNTQDQLIFEVSKQLLGWDRASGQARRWWSEVEALNIEKPRVLLGLTAELLTRAVEIEDFYLICSYSGRRGVRENLEYLDRVLQDRVDEHGSTLH